VIGDVSIENCESEKKAAYFASKLCVDENVIIVFDEIKATITIKHLSKCSIPESCIHNVTWVGKRDVDCIDDIGNDLTVSMLL
jgi:hypothetical protein